MTANVAGFPNNPVTLGLVGLHLVINTQLHPEFVWATFEHVNNAPNCTNSPGPTRSRLVLPQQRLCDMSPAERRQRLSAVQLQRCPTYATLRSYRATHPSLSRL